MSGAADRVARSLAAAMIGAVAALPVLGIVHDLSPAHPSLPASWAIAAVLLAGAVRWFGTPIAGSVTGRGAPVRVTVALLAGPMGSLPVVMPLLALLSEPTDPVAQLAWTLGEEDNAQIVGIAREVIVQGPRGGVLAEQYGTGVIVLATTLMRLMRAPDPTLDPRFLAIHAFTLSTLIAVTVLAVAVGLLVAVVVTPVGSTRRLSGIGTVATGAVTALTTTAALTVAVLVPMRTGFLTFVWGITWTVISAALAAAALRASDRRASIAAAVAVLAAILLLIRSWPFLGAAVLPAAAVMVSLLPIGSIVRQARSHPAIAAIATLLGLLVAVLYLLRSALGEVLSYGLDALTISASGIVFAGTTGLAAMTAVGVAVVTLRRDGDQLRRTVVVVGPAVLGWLSWLGLNGAAQVLTDGELNYGGAKLLYGVVAVAMATAAPVAATAWSGRDGRGVVAAGLAATLIGALVLAGGPAQELERWTARLEPSAPPHAQAMVEAIRRTAPDLPVRCRPTPGTPVTPTSRWAAYFCVRWVEDALNGPGRDDGQRMALLRAPDGTFDAIVAEATAEGLYGFAYVMPLGPGWFGWDGAS